MSLLGIDLGAGGCTATVFSVEGALVAHAQREYQPIAGPDGLRELDAHQVWAAAREAIAEAAAGARGDPVQALSVASIGEALAPLGSDGRIAGRALLDLGSQALPYVEALAEHLGVERIYDLARQLPGPHYWLPKLCWLRERQPGSIDRTWVYVSLSGLVCYLLGGAATSDYSLASSTLMLDSDRRDWSRDLLAECRLPVEKLPRLAAAGTPVGTLSPAVAREVGLSPKVRLLLGGHSQACQALGAGVIRAGAALFGLAGHAYVIATFQAVPLISLMRERGLDSAYHVVPGLHTSRLVNPSGGVLLRWVRDQLAPLERRLALRRGTNPYDALLSEMPDAPTRLLALPHLAPVSPDRKASVAGSRGSPSGAVLGLTLSTTRGEIVKGLLEGMTLYLAEGQGLLEQSGVRVSTYRSAGEGSRSDAWQQLAADVLGVPVERTAQADPAALGAAILAGVGSTLYPGIEQAVERVVRVIDRFEPDPARHDAYVRKLAQYRELDALLAPYLTRLREGG